MEGDNPKKKSKKVTKLSKASFWKWPIKIFFLALMLSLFFSITSEMLLSRTGIVIAVLVILLFITLSVVTDMIGVAVTATSSEPFKAMASKKVRGAKESLFLIRNAEKVSSLCNDVIGDVCGILSGAAGASIIAKIVSTSSDALTIIIASLISAVIAGLTIFGKAVFKKTAIHNCNKVVLAVGKFLSIFTKQKQLRSKKNKKIEIMKVENETQKKNSAGENVVQEAIVKDVKILDENQNR